MIEPDRKNGMIVSERSNAELYVTLVSIIFGLSLTVYDYYTNGTYVWYWWIVLPIGSAAIIQYILKFTILPIAEKRHQNPELEKYYFRSGISIGKERYNQTERDELMKKQNEEPVLFTIKENDNTEKYYYLFENRTWISDEKLDLETVKTEIEAYHKMKNI